MTEISFAAGVTAVILGWLLYRVRTLCAGQVDREKG